MAEADILLFTPQPRDPYALRSEERDELDFFYQATREHQKAWEDALLAYGERLMAHAHVTVGQEIVAPNPGDPRRMMVGRDKPLPGSPLKVVSMTGGSTGHVWVRCQQRLLSGRWGKRLCYLRLEVHQPPSLEELGLDDSDSA